MSPHMSRRWIVTLAAALLIFLMSGCLVTEDSPAPGCVKRIGIPLMGGCSGKTIILDVVIEPQTECLIITVNNCNGGVLELNNSCQETLVLPGVSLEPQESEGLDVVLQDGQHLLVMAAGNFSDYVPASDERIELVGKLGEQEVRLSFTKTAPLCD